MTTVKLQDVYQQVRDLMTEYGIGDNTLFIEANIKQYKHVPGRVESELKLSMFLADNNIAQISGTTVKGIMMQVEGILIDWKAKQDSSTIELTTEV